MPITRRAALAALAAPALLRAPPLAAQTAGTPAGTPAGAFPSRPIRIVVPFPGGGATDLTARVVAERMGPILGQPVVIDNRPGAGGNVGSDLVAKAEPDGHTLLMCTIGTASINQFLYSRLPFDPMRDISAVALVNEVPNVIVVAADRPERTLADLLAHARAQPGALNHGSPGNGTSGHLCGEYLKARTGVEMTHVPYRGSAQVIPDLLGGRLQVALDNLPPYLPHIKEGRMRALAVTSARRTPTLPDVPTVSESGVEGFEATAWFGIQAPSRVPQPVVARLASVIEGIVREPAVAEKLREIGSEPRPLGPEEFAAYIRRENDKWREVVRVSGARLD